MGCIYRAVCTKNGKIYVGQTTKASWSDRYRALEAKIKWAVEEGIRLRPFDRAVRKHGIEAFEFRDLMTNVPDEMLDGLERFFIKLYRTTEKKFGYNCESGGNFRKRAAWSTRLKMREGT
jgi:hypothetical protein